LTNLGHSIECLGPVRDSADFEYRMSQSARQLNPNEIAQESALSSFVDVSQFHMDRLDRQ